MKVRYMGPSFGATGLTDGQAYDCLGVACDGMALRIIDDSGEDYLYSAKNPAPLDGSVTGGRWIVIEDDADGTLRKTMAQTSTTPTHQAPCSIWQANNKQEVTDMPGSPDAPAQENGRQRTAGRRVMLRRILLVAGLGVLLLIFSVIIAALLPPPDARAGSGVDQAVVRLDDLIGAGEQIVTAEQEMPAGYPPPPDSPPMEIADYADIEAARRGGYTGYAPAHLPEGYALENVWVLPGQTSTRASFTLRKGDWYSTISYFAGNNVQFDLRPDDDAIIEPFAWNGFSGSIAQQEDGSFLLLCVNDATDEKIVYVGLSPADEIVQIITHFEKPEALP